MLILCVFQTSEYIQWVYMYKLRVHRMTLRGDFHVRVIGIEMATDTTGQDHERETIKLGG